MPVKFLADANLDQDIVTGLVRRQGEIDFALPQDMIREGMKDPEVLQVAASFDRILVTHDVRTMPKHFGQFVTRHASSGVILVPAKMAIGTVIEELLMIWELSEPGDWQNRIRRLPL